MDTPKTPKTHGDLINALGGPSDLARKLDIYRPVPATVHWRTRGIPARYWHSVADLAAAAGIKMTAADLAALPVAPIEVAA